MWKNSPGARFFASFAALSSPVRNMDTDESSNVMNTTNMYILIVCTLRLDKMHHGFIHCSV